MRKISVKEFLFGPETGFDCFGPWQTFEQFKTMVRQILNDYVWENEKVAPRTRNGLPQGGAPFQKFHVPCDDTLWEWFSDLGKKKEKEECEEREECPDGFASDRDYWLWKNG